MLEGYDIRLRPNFGGKTQKNTIKFEYFILIFNTIEKLFVENGISLRDSY